MLSFKIGGFSLLGETLFQYTALKACPKYGSENIWFPVVTRIVLHLNHVTIMVNTFDHFPVYSTTLNIHFDKRLLTDFIFDMFCSH